MVRSILVATALFVVPANVGWAEFFQITNQEKLSAFLNFAESSADDVLLDFKVGGGRWKLEGSWPEDTKRLRGFFWVPGNDKQLLPEEIVIDLPSDRMWRFEALFIEGVMRGGDWAEVDCRADDDCRGEIMNDVDIFELNSVRNWFGRVDSFSENGDVDYNGVVDINDLNIIRNNFGNSLGVVRWIPAAAVPEPTTACLMLAGLFGLSTRRARSLRR